MIPSETYVRRNYKSGLFSVLPVQDCIRYRGILTMFTATHLFAPSTMTDLLNDLLTQQNVAIVIRFPTEYMQGTSPPV